MSFVNVCLSQSQMQSGIMDVTDLRRPFHSFNQHQFTGFSSPSQH